MTRPALVPALTAVAAALGGGAALDLPVSVKLTLVLGAILIVLCAGVTASVSLVCVALPFAMIQISIGRTSWSPLELTLIACWASTAVAIARELVRCKNLRPILGLARPYDLAFAAVSVVVVGALSMLWIVEGGSNTDAVREYRGVILEPLILAPAVMYVKQKGGVRLVLPWLVVPAVLVAILATGQLALQMSVVEIGRIARPRICVPACAPRKVMVAVVPECGGRE